MEISQILLNYIQEHNISMREAARRCGVSHQTIINIINGTNSRGDPMQPDVETISKISRGLLIPEYKLMGYDDAKEFYKDLLAEAFKKDDADHGSSQPLTIDEQFDNLVSRLNESQKILLMQKIANSLGNK